MIYRSLRSFTIVLSHALLVLVNVVTVVSAAIALKVPASEGKVKGTVEIGIEVKEVAGVAAVEYLLDGRSLSDPIAVAPFNYSWATIESFDGPTVLEAVALDANGQALAKSAPLALDVDNGIGTIKATSPENFEQPLRGTVKWTIVADRTFTDEETAQQKAAGIYPKPIEAMILYVDGRQVNTIAFGAATMSVDLDTTRYANGPHELFATAYAFKTGLPPAAMWRKTVTFDNGHAPREIRARWSTMFLAPGKSGKLSPRLVYTDGQEESLAEGIAFTSDQPNVATVDEQGTVTAIAPGVANLTLDGRGHSSKVCVIVDQPHGFPHFAKDGAILTEHDPARSIFVRTLFFCSPDAVERDPLLAEQLRAAGVNALTSGFYSNPVDNGAKDFEAWRAIWEPRFDRWIKIAADANLGICFSGDDIARTANELHNSVTSPWASQAIQFAFTKARDSKRTIFVEMVDEVSMMWGENPKPSDGRWSKGAVKIPDDAFIQLMQTINSVAGRPPVTWPPLGIASSVAAENWLGDPAISDYATIYWTYHDFRRAYPLTTSLAQDHIAIDRNVRGWLPFIQRDKPRLMLTALGGFEYLKNVEGTDYTRGKDQPWTAGISDASVAAEPFYAIAMGLAGVRAYHFDAFDEMRKNAAIGTPLGTGASPFGCGTDRWQAMSAAFNLIQAIEPYLLQPQIHAPQLGPTIVTGARQGAAGRVVIAVNFSEAEERTLFDLSAYRYSTGSPIVQYRLHRASLATNVLPTNSPSAKMVTFEPGEVIVWVFPATSKSDLTPPTARISAPISNCTVAGGVEITAETSDAERVEFVIDGKKVATVSQPPFIYRWNSDETVEGIAHGIRVVAYDKAGNVGLAGTMVRSGTP